MPGGGRVIRGRVRSRPGRIPIGDTCRAARSDHDRAKHVREIQWALFEPNHHRLRAALRSNIDEFMNSLFHVEAFTGIRWVLAYSGQAFSATAITRATP